jgi:hypothetical protein
MRRHYLRARAIATRIFPSRRCSSARAIARRSWRSIASCARPTMSPTTPPQAPTKSCACSKTCASSLMGASDASPEGVALRNRLLRSAGSPPTTPPISGSVPPRRHQAALCRLGRADGLLPLFGDAGRPLRARRAWRGPRDLAAFRRAVRRASGHQPSCRIAARITARSTASIFRSTRWTNTAPRPRCSPPPRATPALRSVIAALARRNAQLLAQSAPFAAHIRDRRLALEVSLIQRLAEDLNASSWSAIPCPSASIIARSNCRDLFLSAFGRFLGGRLALKGRP